MYIDYLHQNCNTSSAEVILENQKSDRVRKEAAMALQQYVTIKKPIMGLNKSTQSVISGLSANTILLGIYSVQ